MRIPASAFRARIHDSLPFFASSQLHTYNPLAMKFRSLSVLSVLLVCLGGFSCGGTAPASGELVVSAAISLKGPMEDLVTIYQERYSDTRVQLNFGASGLLSSQIERGAPVDVYASASVRFLDELQRQHLLIPDSRKPLAGNRLVLIVPKDSSLFSTDWSVLVSTSRIALGNPKTVPAGTYARECLQSLGLWKKLSSRFVFAEHVRQVLEYVAQGEVGAGLVYSTDAAILPDDIRILAEAPPGSHSPIRYGIAAVASSEMAEAARRFVELATSKLGGEVLGSHGFSPPES